MTNHSCKTKILSAAIAVCFLASGCSVTSITPMRNEVEQVRVESGSRIGAAQDGRKLTQAIQAPVVQKTDAIYLPVRKIAAKKSDKGDNDPALRRQIGMNRTFVSAQDFAEQVTRLTGVPVNVQPDVFAQPAQANQGGALAGTMNGGGLPPLPSPTGMTMGSMNMPGFSTPSTSGFPLNLSYNGSVSGLLDTASVRMGVSWEMRDGQIKLFRYTSKTMRLSALPGDTSMTAGIGTNTASTGGSSGGSGAGASAASASTQANTSTQQAGVAFSGLSVWKGIEDSVKAMLSPNGKVVVAPSLGTVTVTDTPAMVAAVEEFIDKQNIELSKQVIVNVRVLSVDLTRSENYGINWDVVYTAMSQNFGVTLASGVAAITGAGTLTSTILNTAGTATNSRIQSWQGTQAIIQALSTQGHVSAVTSASITTLNNQPSPLQVGRQTGYLASSQTTITTGVATTALTPGTVNTGFSMTLVPHVIEGNKMLLQYALDISSLLALTTLTSGPSGSSSVIQNPDIDSRTSIQRVLVTSGDTIVVSGFENNQINATNQGVIDADNPALGGAVKGTRSKSTIVILIQPVLLPSS